MAETSMLWDAGGGGDQSPHSEANVADLFKAMVGGNGVFRGYLNQLAPSVSGTNVLVDTGWAMVDGHPYRNDSSKSTAITVPSIGTTGHRLVLRANWSAQTVRIFDISSADNTAAIPAATTTSGTTYDVTLATFTITTGGAITLTDAREYAPSIVPGMALVAANSTAQSTTSTSATDLLTLTPSTSIGINDWALLRFEYRKQALAANAVSFGLKVNSTTVRECDTTAGIAVTTATNRAEAGFCEVLIPPRSTANYGFGIRLDYRTYTTAGAWAAGRDGIADAVGMTAALPNAAITSVTVRAQNHTASNAAEVKNAALYIIKGV